MSFHPDKCLVLRHSRSRTPIITPYILHGQTLDTTPSTKYLGATIQDDGEWKEHINQQATKGNKLLGFLRRNIKIDNKKAKEELYMMLIQQPLEYAASIWDPHHQTDINKLENVQRRAARFVQGDFKQTSSVTAMLNKLKWPSLQQRRKELRIRLLTKIIQDKVTVSKHHLIPARERPRRTHDYQFKLITCNRNFRQYAFFPRTIRDWNALPADSVPKDIDSFFGKSQ